MTAINYPREFAGDSTFGSGSDNGQPTKVDPGAAAEAQGLIPGLPFSGAHMNHSINAVSRATRYLIEQCLSNLISPPVADEDSLNEQAYDGPGAVVANLNGERLMIKGGVTLQDLGGVAVRYGSAPAGAAQPVCAAGPRVASGTIAVVGSFGLPGSNGGVARSTSSGASWLQVENATGDALQRIILNPGTDQFLWHGDVVGEIYASTTLSSKSTRALSALHLVRGLAARSSGLSLVLRSNGVALAGFDSSPDDGGTAYASTGGAPTSTADFGDIASNGTLFFWAGKNAANQIAVWASSTGASWSQVGTIASPSGTIGTAPSARLVCDTSSGILWLAVNANSRWFLYASPDSGVTWIGPRDIGTSMPTLSAVGGYLYVGITGKPFLRTPFRLS